MFGANIATAKPVVARFIGGLLMAAAAVAVRLDLVAASCIAQCGSNPPRYCQADSPCTCTAKNGEGCTIFCPGMEPYASNCS